MHFTEYLESRKRMVDSALDAILPPASFYPEQIHSAMRYAVFPGGKRFRAALLLASHETFNGDPADALPFACAVELVHSYSLAHDDLPSMDDDDFRRGLPSLHRKFGEAAAILAGDALLTAAFAAASCGGGRKLGAGKTLEALNCLAAAAGSKGMLGGQAADVAGKKPHPPGELDYIHRKKTAELIKFSAKSGALLAGAQGGELEAAAGYGLNLGLAFQMLDDIKDAGRNSDEPNFAESFGIMEAEKKTGQFTGKARKFLSRIGEDTKLLEGFIGYTIESWKNA